MTRNTKWQYRTRTKTMRGRWGLCGGTPAFMRPRYEYRCVQVVDAARRGDQCYAGRTGWYWHELDAQCGIAEATVRGPFPTEQAAWEASLLPCRRTGTTHPQLGDAPQLKEPGGLRIVSVAVVNETPGSRREVQPGQLGAELRRMGGEGLGAALDRLAAARGTA